MRSMRRIRNQRGQSTVEYVLAISVVVIAIGAAFYEIIGTGHQGPVAQAFTNARTTVEAPVP